jgi:hypothetical protein
VDAVVVQFLDRFGRNPREILGRIWELEGLGVLVACTDEDIEEELVLLVRAGVAGKESEKISQRVRANMAGAVRRGVHPARPPFGHRGILGPPDPRTLRVHIASYELAAGEVEALRLMRRLLVEENRGRKFIADRLNADGYRTRRGNLWDPTSVKRVLGNESLRGALVWGLRPRPGNPRPELVRIEGFYPRIFSDEEFAEIQAVLARRRGVAGSTNRSVYLLSGIARCAHCRGPLTGKVGMKRRRGGRYRNYWCRNHMRAREKCAHANGHAQGRLERAVLEALAAYADPEAAGRCLVAEAARRQGEAEAAEDEAELKRVEGELAVIDREFLVQMRLLAKGGISEEQFVLANADASARKAELEGRREELRGRLERRARAGEARRERVLAVRSFLADFGQLSPQEQKARLQGILEVVWVWEDGRVEVVCRE